MAPFYISCTTCKTRLKVRDASAVGEIHTCPRCGSMVMITPPRPHQVAGSTGSDSSQELIAAAGATSGAAPLLDFTFDDAVEILNQDAAPPRQAPPAATPDVPAVGHATPAPVAAPKRVDLWADTVEELAAPNELAAETTAAAPAHAASAAVAASSADVAVLADTVDANSATDIPSPAEAESIAMEGAYAEPPMPSDQWLAPSAQVWRQWLLLGGAAVMGVALAVAVFGYAVLQANRNAGRAVADAEPPLSDKKPDTDPDDTPTAAPPSTDDAISPPADDGDKASAGSFDRAEAAPPKAPADPADAPRSPDADPPPPLNEEPESPFEAPKPHEPEATAPTDETLAGGADLVEKFGGFLGGSEFVSPIPTPAVAAEPEPPPEDASAAPSSEPSAEETPLPRPAPREVDVPARLADPLAGLEFTNVPLRDFLKLMSDLSTIPITLEPEALAWRRLTPHVPVSVRLTDTTVEKALGAALDPLGLAAAVEDGHLVVTTASSRDNPVRQLKHPVEDLTEGDPQRLVELAALIERLVAPESWKGAGGVGSIAPDSGGLMIEQSEMVHFRVIAFCETLRVARGLPLRTKFDAARFQSPSPQQAAAAKLATPVALNFHQPTELTAILDAFGKAAGVTILVDWRAAADAGWPPDAQGSVVADGVPLREALTKLLAPMDLTYRVVDGATLQVTTPEQLRSRIETAFYPVADLLMGKFTAGTLLDRIKSDLGEDRFVEGRSGLHLDERSGRLIVALPQPQHDELTDLLEQWRMP